MEGGWHSAYLALTLSAIWGPASCMMHEDTHNQVAQPPLPSGFLLLAVFLNFVFKFDEFKVHSLNFRLFFS